ncbi:MAG: PIN domain nuclease [Rhodomicrobium sp.]
MILADSSVWIDYFNGRISNETDLLDGLLGQQLVLTGDLILAEVLQGFRHEKDYRIALRLFESIEIRNLGGRDIAVRAAQNYRALRAKGITPRKTIDMIIATYCIAHGLPLLHADRDFDVAETELGLAVVRRT